VAVFLDSPFETSGKMISFARSVVDAVTSTFGEGYVVAPGQSPHSPRLYSESHYALALILLYLLDGHDDRRLQLAADRLNKWEQLGEPETFFNSFAILLSKILADLYKITHPELIATLNRLCHAHKSTYKDAWAAGCGNNMYVQQGIADLLLYPLAVGKVVGEAEVDVVLAEFARFRSPEGLYFDGPRSAGSERLFPLTYCMKFLFLLGIAYKLQGHESFRKAFVDGLKAVVPLMTSEGGFSYFGRTDNTSFAVGLTIFVLRLGAEIDSSNRTAYSRLAQRQEQCYKSTPQTTGGYLQVNRLREVKDPSEYEWSRDVYSDPTQYSIASAAYILLGELLCSSPAAEQDGENEQDTQVTYSEDLGIARLCASGVEAFVRTLSNTTNHDRRYIGPTVLRFAAQGRLTVGAVPVTCSDDGSYQLQRGRALRILKNIWHKYHKGMDDLDARYTGFVPVLMDGSDMLLPVRVVRQRIEGRCLETEYEFGRRSFRGWPVVLDQLLSYWSALGLPGAQQHSISRAFVAEPDIHFTRRQQLTETADLLIEDTLLGNLRHKVLWFSTRYIAGEAVDLTGLPCEGHAIGWGSDGEMQFDFYAQRCAADQISYNCRVRGIQRSLNARNQE
jgi:hypothetical protein